MPIFINDKWWGYFGFDTCSFDREWTRSETDALRAASEIFSAAIMRQQSEEREKQMRTAAYTAAMEWRLTFDAMEYAILILDEHNHVKRLNNAAREMTGRTFQEVVGDLLTRSGTPPFGVGLQNADGSAKEVSALGTKSRMYLRAAFGTLLSASSVKGRVAASGPFSPHLT